MCDRSSDFLTLGTSYNILYYEGMKCIIQLFGNLPFSYYQLIILLVSAYRSVVC
jgi:hypothetical protein